MVALVPAGDEVVPAAIAARADVAHLGIELPRMSGLDAAAALRERDVLMVAAGGASMAEAARPVHLSESTVRNHLPATTARTGTRNRVKAVLAQGKGWL